MNRKKILISLPYGMSARNILRSQIYEELTRVFDITLLTPFYQDRSFLGEFSRPGVDLLDFPKNYNIFFKAYRFLLDYVEGPYFTQKSKIHTFQLLAQTLKEENRLSYFIRHVIGAITVRSPYLVFCLRKLQECLATKDHFLKILREKKPDLVFQTHILALEEYPLAFSVKQMGIPLVGMVHSWDNLTTKSGFRLPFSRKPGRLPPVQYDHLIVWNFLQKEELRSYYGYQENQASVVGIPQMDHYCNGSFSSRISFFQSIGADPSKKLILFALPSLNLMPRQEEVLEMLIKILRSNSFRDPVQLLIRAHPGEKMSFLEELKSRFPEIYVQNPSPAYSAFRHRGGWNKSDQQDLAESIYHCDILINVASTTSLDAAVLNKPIICIGFDGYQNAPYYSSVRMHYDFSHYQPVMNSGAVRLAKSPLELEEQIRSYLEDPSQDSENRKQLVCTLDPFGTDGKAANRVVQTLINQAN
ncbi:MAG: CDP-glycerol glycerophosphotransferase family protein [Deltaproteobacteria bacterium]|nr:CDP-glycerol glycerophosphotransferase family protein [Deltaproteobacteria bacterium]